MNVSSFAPLLLLQCLRVLSTVFCVLSFCITPIRCEESHPSNLNKQQNGWFGIEGMVRRMTAKAEAEEAKAEAEKPAYGRARAALAVGESVANPMDWLENIRRLAKVPLILHSCRSPVDENFKRIHESAMRVVTIATQMQSQTREQVQNQFKGAVQSIQGEAKLGGSPTGLSASAGASGKSETTTNNVKKAISSTNFPSVPRELAEQFNSAYGELFKEYEDLIRSLDPKLLDRVLKADP
jgi:hypothetical protein